MFLDLHVHTVKGSSDSSLSPEDMVAEAKRIGLHGICVTEHGGGWDKHDFQRFAQQQELLLLRAMEVETEMGHILVLGLETYVSGIFKVPELRRVVDQAGGVIIAAHPFRGLYNPPPYNKLLINKNLDLDIPTSVEEAAQHPLFQYVDAVEVANGANTERENLFSYQVARSLGKGGTGGSDAHSINGLGRCITVFDDVIHSVEDLVRAMKAGRFRPALDLNIGHFTPFEV